MKISSNFHDYYDSLRAMDQDDDPLYVRLRKEYPLNDNPYYGSRVQLTTTPQDRQHGNQIRGYTVHVGGNGQWWKSSVIGFCGRVYPFITIGIGKNAKHAFTPQRALKLIQQYEDLSDMPRHFSEIKREKQGLLQLLNRPLSNYYNHFQFAQWANLLNNNQIGDTIFRHFKSPVLLVEEIGLVPTLITNPILRQCDFVQVLTPQQVYQELSMFIGNNLADVNRVPPRPISDKLKAESKGFDKWSFKNTKNRPVWTSIENAEPNSKGYEDDPNWQRKK
jgi:hypothetical protein